MAQAQQQPRVYSTTLPAPTMGWCTRYPLDSMPATNAIRLKNWFPGEMDIRLRNGCSSFATALGGPVQSGFEQISAAGVHTCLAAANGHLWDISAGGAGVSKGSGFSSNIWQSIHFKNVLLLFNGADQPQQWNGTTLSAANYTGIADDAVFIQGTAYRSSLYLVKKDSTSVFYLPAASITGAVTEFDFGPEFTAGGYLLFVTTLSTIVNDNVTQRFLACSSEGELLLYSGAYPGNDAWSIVGRLQLPRPMTRRGFICRKADVEIVTEEGFVSVQKALQGMVRPLEDTSPLQNIAPTIANACNLYPQYFGWDVVHYPRGQMIVTNVPTVVNSQSEQYVRNSLTDAWCDFTGWNACCFFIYNGDLYYGGTDASGVVYKANDGDDDNGANIDWDIKFPFTFLGDKENQKHVTTCKPYMVTNGSVNIGLDVDVDFEDKTILDTITVVGPQGTPWNSAPWNSFPWGVSIQYVKDRYSIAGLGTLIALRIKGAAKNISMRMTAASITYTKGGVL